MIYHLMMLCWKIDDLFPFWTPFCWLGDLLEDFGLDHGLIRFNNEIMECIHRHQYDRMLERLEE